ncbi:MAG TPA: CotH kinase family protein [Candidatus Binatia bacterium]|nr:CotH kinase family protein [Candidatus Binatia bacterium]
MRRNSFAALWAVLLLLSPGARADSDLFVDGAVWRIRLEVTSDDVRSLRNHPREYVHATLREGTNILREVAVRLKGSTSFRSVDDKPSFTVNCDRFTDGQLFHGLSKIHLNNSVEDPSYLNEKLGSEMFSTAGLPAPRVSHALVELNGRRLGFYVLKEGFAEEFLARHFRRADGNLFEPQAGVAPDVTGPMTRNSDDSAGDSRDLQRLATASAQDSGVRWKALREILDLDRFVTFMAMEVLSGHRDGYCLARNNYRIYHDPASGRFVFLPDGMDQLFGRADFPVEPHMAGVVAKAVLETDEGRQAYRKGLAQVFTNCFKVEALVNRVHAWSGAIAPKLTRAEARALRHEADDFCERIRQRAHYVRRQLAGPALKPPDE